MERLRLFGLRSDNPITWHSKNNSLNRKETTCKFVSKDKEEIEAIEYKRIEDAIWGIYERLPSPKAEMLRIRHITQER